MDIINDTKDFFSSRFLNVFGIPTGKFDYFVATRRKKDNMVAAKSEEEYKTMTPDAVSCALIFNINSTPYLFLQNEFRFPLNHFVLSPPAGLVDDSTGDRNEDIKRTALREIFEETGYKASENVKVKVVSPLLFSTPGMTDESNALVSVVVCEDKIPEFNHDNTVGGETFEKYVLLNRDEVKTMLKRGLDENGNPYPVWTWAVMMWFISNMWEV